MHTYMRTYIHAHTHTYMHKPCALASRRAANSARSLVRVVLITAHLSVATRRSMSFVRR